MKLTMHDLYEIEAAIRLDDSGFDYTPIRGDELLALIRIVRATVAYHNKPNPETGKALLDALREAGL